MGNCASKGIEGIFAVKDSIPEKGPAIEEAKGLRPRIEFLKAAYQRGEGLSVSGGCVFHGKKFRATTGVSRWIPAKSYYWRIVLWAKYPKNFKGDRCVNGPFETLDINFISQQIVKSQAGRRF